MICQRRNILVLSMIKITIWLKNLFLHIHEERHIYTVLIFIKTSCTLDNKINIKMSFAIRNFF